MAFVTVLVAATVTGALAPRPRPAAGAPRATVTCPSVGSDGYRHLSPSSARNIPKIVQACPGGSKFKLAGGSYAMTDTIVPKSNDVFVGNGASGSKPTVLYGSRNITCKAGGSNPCANWVHDSSGQWHFTITTNKRSAIAKICTSSGAATACNGTGYAGQDDIWDSDGTGENCVSPGGYPQAVAGQQHPGICDYPDSLFVNDAFYARVLNSDPAHPCSPSVLPAGKAAYCVNYYASSNGDHPTIYLGVNPSKLGTIRYSGVLDPNDPSGRGILQWAFNDIGPSGAVTGVSIRGVKITEYGDSVGDLGVVRAGTGWTVGDPSALPGTGHGSIVVSLSHTCGVNLDGPATVVEGDFRYNGQRGGCGSGRGSGSTVIDDNFRDNNHHPKAAPDQFNGGRAGAGFKASGITNLTVVGNTVYGNVGSGLWFDDGSTAPINVGGNTVRGQLYDSSNPVQGGSGILFEISCGTASNPLYVGGPVTAKVGGASYTFHGNTVYGNANTGVRILNSSGVTVGPATAGANSNTIGNTSAYDSVEVGILSTGRTYSCSADSSTSNNLVRNNVIWVGPDTRSMVYGETLNGIALLYNNRVQGNVFHLSPTVSNAREYVGFGWATSGCVGCTLTINVDDWDHNTYEGVPCTSLRWSMPNGSTSNLVENFADWQAGANGKPAQDTHGSCTG